MFLVPFVLSFPDCRVNGIITFWDWLLSPSTVLLKFLMFLHGLQARMLTHMVRVELPLEETTKLFSGLAIKFCNLTSNVVLGPFSVYFLGFSTQSIMLSAKRNSFIIICISVLFLRNFILETPVWCWMGMVKVDILAWFPILRGYLVFKYNLSCRVF